MIYTDSNSRIETTDRRLIMFDWDGVLADSLDIFTTVFLQSCRQCGFHGLREPGQLMGLFDENLFQAMQKLGLGQEIIGQILVCFKRNMNTHVHEIKLFDGVAWALNTIARKHTVTIITSNISEIPLNVLAREGVKSVEQVLGAEIDTSKTRKIRQTISRYPDSQPFYVGDTKGDMLEGKEAGASTIAVTWGWHSMEKLDEGNPDYRVSSPRELAVLLG